MERELEALEKLKLTEVLARARESGQPGKDSVSSEALVHILRREARTANAHVSGLDGLISILIQRAETNLRRHLGDGFDEFQREEICREVVDLIVDAICDDSDRADYAEINFNDWLAHNRVDACRKQKRKAARTERLGDSVEKLAEDKAKIAPGGIDDDASPEPTPEDACALDEAREKARLPPQIEAGEFSPEDQYRIAAMFKRANLPPNVLEAFLLHHYWGMTIESKHVDKYTLAKHFGRSEKTIRLWLGRAAEAFARLRGETSEHETDEASEPRLGAARLPR